MKRLVLATAAAAVAVPLAHGQGSVARTTSICHRTTSSARPYVLLKVTPRSLKSHAKHAADIVPAPKGGCPKTVLKPNSGGVAASVTMTGEAESPAGDPVGTGSATIRMRLGQGQICFALRADNVTLPAAGAHIHRAAVGSSGPIVVQLVAPGTTGASSGCVAVTRTLVSELLSSPSSFYVNVHTTDFPAGAIRGQLSGTSAAQLGKTFVVSMNGANERPNAADPDGSGTAVVRIRADAGQICFRLSVKNIVLPAAGAHIHRGSAAVAGPIVVPLQAPGATAVSAGCTAVDKALIDEILANPANFYANVHTTEYPGGAIRAQLS